MSNVWATRSTSLRVTATKRNNSVWYIPSVGLHRPDQSTQTLAYITNNCVLTNTNQMGLTFVNLCYYLSGQFYKVTSIVRFKTIKGNIGVLITCRYYCKENVMSAYLWRNSRMESTEPYWISDFFFILSHRLLMDSSRYTTNFNYCRRRCFQLLEAVYVTFKVYYYLLSDDIFLSRYIHMYNENN